MAIVIIVLVIMIIILFGQATKLPDHWNCIHTNVTTTRRKTEAHFNRDNSSFKDLVQEFAKEDV